MNKKSRKITGGIFVVAGALLFLLTSGNLSGFGFWTGAAGFLILATT